MQQDTVMPFPPPPLTAAAPLTAVLRQGAQRLLAPAIEVAVAMLLARYAEQHDAEGRQAVVRTGYLPEREVHAGIGAVRVKVPRVRARSGAGIRFHAALLPPSIHRSKSLEALLPWRHLKGLSTGDFSEAFQALLGPEAPGWSPATLSRLKQGWPEELAQWQQRNLSGKRDVYCWGDGGYLETRLEDARHCLLVIIGADASGQKALVGLWDGDRESAQSWKALLLDLKSRGLAHGPTLAMGDGALGLWKALRQVQGQTRGQRCWVPQTANMLDKLPQDLQARATQRLQAIWMAPDRQRAELAFDWFMAAYEAKDPKAAECLAQDRAGLWAFDDFPAEHWGHMRTTNPSIRIWRCSGFAITHVSLCDSSVSDKPGYVTQPAVNLPAASPQL